MTCLPSLLFCAVGCLSAKEVFFFLCHGLQFLVRKVLLFIVHIRRQKYTCPVLIFSKIWITIRAIFIMSGILDLDFLGWTNGFNYSKVSILYNLRHTWIRYSHLNQSEIVVAFSVAFYRIFTQVIEALLTGPYIEKDKNDSRIKIKQTSVRNIKNSSVAVKYLLTVVANLENTGKENIYLFISFKFI